MPEAKETIRISNSAQFLCTIVFLNSRDNDKKVGPISKKYYHYSILRLYFAQILMLHETLVVTPGVARATPRYMKVGTFDEKLFPSSRAVLGKSFSYKCVPFHV